MMGKQWYRMAAMAACALPALGCTLLAAPQPGRVPAPPPARPAQPRTIVKPGMNAPRPGVSVPAPLPARRSTAPARSR